MGYRESEGDAGSERLLHIKSVPCRDGLSGPSHGKTSGPLASGTKSGGANTSKKDKNNILTKSL